MTRTSDWVEGYARAWRSTDADDVRALFADDGEYWFRPNDAEPVRGIDAIVEMWIAEEEPSVPTFAFEVLVEDERVGVATGHVEYPGHETYANLWEIHFAPDGRARRFVEWFMTPRAETPSG